MNDMNADAGKGFAKDFEGKPESSDIESGVGSGCLVRLSGVHKSYKKGKLTVDVLRGLDLEIKRGEFLALMGPSGSGKTTLLNLIGGLHKPSSGSVLIAQHDLSAMSGSQLANWRARHVGFVFQFYHLIPVLSAAQNIELPLFLTSLSRERRKKQVEVALKLVSLPDKSGFYPSELSGGQEQRVAIARAIVSDPDLLICDEPTGDLDRDSANEILELLQRLNRDHGKTIVMVTHDPIAADYARRKLVMEKGRVAARSAP